MYWTILMIVYQTLEDRENPDDIEENGPFACTHGMGWLGNGYYFWDTHIELAHWWGEAVHNKNYVICKANMTMSEDCWDLHGTGDHRLEFDYICDELVTAKLVERENLIVSDVINYLIKQKIFKYNAIRAMGNNSISDRKFNHFLKRLPFKRAKRGQNNYQYFDVYPPVQICLLNKKALSLRDFYIVYPPEYMQYA